jgi:hypothetical protein
LCDWVVSAEIPTSTAPVFERPCHASRNEQASFVHPGVSSFG